MTRIRVVSVGLGPIGLSAARLALSKRSLKLVGAVDPDPEKVGRDLGDLLGSDSVGIPIIADAKEVYQQHKPDAILHCTSSFFARVYDQLMEAVEAGVNVVSSSEELLEPKYRNPELAAKLHRAALEHSVSILGTGVNPGFAMDFLAAVASAITDRVDSVRCRRVVDASTRRRPLQDKVGAGLSPEEFQIKMEAGGFGHIGMEESVALLGRALGFGLTRVEQSLHPVLSDRRQQTCHRTVEKGQVAGIRNLGFGWVGEQQLVELDLTMAVGAENPIDEISLLGEPPVCMSFPGGIPGDRATAAILVNSLPQVVRAEPGLHTVMDLPIPRVVR